MELTDTHRYSSAGEDDTVVSLNAPLRLCYSVTEELVDLSGPFEK